jgi:predicted Zn-dependent protease
MRREELYHTKKRRAPENAALHLFVRGLEMDKIAMLTEILAQEPTNAFARYGLAMEHAGQGDATTALTEFDRLLADHPDYTAGYFMAAQTLAKTGENSRALDYLRRGLDSARRTGNQHAYSEMQAMMDELEALSL